MKRGTLNLLIDFTAAILAGGLIATGLIVRYVLPPGTGRRFAAWGMTRHDWGDVHFWIAVAMLGIFLLHIALHWRWVVAMFRQIIRRTGARTDREPSRALQGLAAAVLSAALLLGFVWWVNNGVAPTDRGSGLSQAASDDAQFNERVSDRDDRPRGRRFRHRHRGPVLTIAE